MTASSSDILLLGINARYRHTAFGLRCLQANLGKLESRSTLVETTIAQLPHEIVDEVLVHNPRIVGLGVYVWNTTLCEQVARLLKTIRPEILLVLGGPEISHETSTQPLAALADYIVCGEGEEVFADLCQDLLAGRQQKKTVLQGTSPPMNGLASPYRLYTDEDLAQRVTYVEASRGCPYRCQFCLSSLDKVVRTVDPDAFFTDMNDLIERGARDFKFIDRTFNLNIDFSLAILRFFLDHECSDLSLHFEMVPDRLPDRLREALQQFPPGMVQLEIGIQTFNPAVAKHIERPQRLDRITDNLQFLREHTNMYLHVDLIVGLPGESMASFGEGLDALMCLNPHEIQVGILKRLKGTPIATDNSDFQMVYSPLPPFDVLSTSDLSFEQTQEMKRFAKYWEIVVNRGQFEHSASFIWRDDSSVFEAFRRFSDWLYARVKRTSMINLLRLAEHLYDYLTGELQLDEHVVGTSLVKDLQRTGGRSIPAKLQRFQTRPGPSRAPTKQVTGRQRQERRE